MRRPLSYSLVGLLLLAAACSKDHTDPEPSLEGRWLMTHSHTLDYTTSNVLEQDYGRVAIGRPFVYKFAGTTMMSINYALRNGAYVPADSMGITYSRVGNTIQFTPAPNVTYVTFELTELTKTAMILERHESGPNGGRRQMIFELTRQ